MASSRNQEPRNRLACERCRWVLPRPKKPVKQKKSKCPGQKPACSFCVRSKQECIYLPRGRREPAATASRVVKATTNDDRFQRLEAQAQQCHQSSLPNPTVALRHYAGTGTNSQPMQHTVDSGLINSLPQEAVVTPSHPFTFSENQPIPPDNILDHLVQAYRVMLHFQPLPLFDIDQLRTRLRSAPPYLLWSFLALTLNVSDHDYYRDKKSEAIKFYSGSAENVIPALAFEGIPKLEIQQSLCLLALKHILARHPAKAWMAIGAASKLESLQTAMQGQCRQDEDLISRCHWSIFVLERLFFPRIVQEPSAGSSFDYPRSTPRPPALLHDIEENEHLDALETEDFDPDDLGINAYYIKSLSVWADILLYLHNLRVGIPKLEQPWLPHSTFTKLNMKIYEAESRMSGQHLLRVVNFHKRSPEEVLEQQEYWHPWITMQLIFHAAPALINHPLVHLSATRRAHLPQSRHFLQQTVDNALFHSGWVFRLIETCEDLLFDLHDPLIGHVVAATATIAWLFQFATDSNISSRAKKGFMQSGKLLRRLASLWPHVERKVHVIDRLQAIANEDTLDGEEQNRHITLPLPELWELLDPDPFEAPYINQNSDRGNTGAANTPRDARIRMSTHIVHPLDHNSATPQSHADGVTTSKSMLIPSQESFEQLYMDDFFTHLQPDQFQW